MQIVINVKRESERASKERKKLIIKQNDSFDVCGLLLVKYSNDLNWSQVQVVLILRNVSLSQLRK
jgi:hypothetical protein